MALADYEAQLAWAQREGQGEMVAPAEEACSCEMLRTPGRRPRIPLAKLSALRWADEPAPLPVPATCPSRRRRGLRHALAAVAKVTR